LISAKMEQMADDEEEAEEEDEAERQEGVLGGEDFLLTDDARDMDLRWVVGGGLGR
jgi:hypothetical protein